MSWNVALFYEVHSARFTEVFVPIVIQSFECSDGFRVVCDEDAICFVLVAATVTRGVRVIGQRHLRYGMNLAMTVGTWKKSRKEINRRLYFLRFFLSYMSALGAVIELGMYGCEVLLRDVLGIGTRESVDDGEDTEGQEVQELSEVNGLMPVYREQLRDELGVDMESSGEIVTEEATVQQANVSYSGRVLQTLGGAILTPKVILDFRFYYDY